VSYYDEETLKDHAVEYVLEHEFDEVEEVIEGANASDWFKKSEPWLQLINAVSQHDRDKLRLDVIKGAYNADPKPLQRVDAEVELQLFNIASDVAKIIESLPQAREYRLPLRSSDRNWKEQIQKKIVGDISFGDKLRSGFFVVTGAHSALARYHVCGNFGENLNWVSDVLTLTRAFRDVLFALSDRDFHFSGLAHAIVTINAALEKGKPALLAYRGQGEFGREPDPDTTPLGTSLAEWICEYLEKYSAHIDLGVCIECGKIFLRQRRDNAYCSKSCQNRVAYKRKKIFESGLLKKLEVKTEADIANLRPGVWAYHSRFGLGVLDPVDPKIPDYPIINVRFPHTLRCFTKVHLLTEGTKLEFYKVTDATMLAELL
jgi:hypothetical protein